MSQLDDPEYARFAWARYRRLMLGMSGAAIVSTAIALLLLWVSSDTLPFHVAVATGLGVFFAVMVAAALMGLVFLSSGSGHDGVIEDPFAEDWSDAAPPGKERDGRHR